MSVRHRLVIPLLAAATLAACGGTPAMPPTDLPDATARLAATEAADRLVVRTSDAAALRRAEAACGGHAIEAIPALGVSVLQLPPGAPPDALARVRTARGVAWAERDQVCTALGVPNDPRWPLQWGPAKIGAPAAWDVGQGAGTTIAILDTGVDQDHEDLVARLGAQRNFTSSRTVDDKYGHGTHCAGIAAAVAGNAKGVAGIAGGARLLNAKVLGDTGTGYTSWIAAGVVWAADQGATVANLSLGGGGPTQVMADALAHAAAKGMLVAAAAGNEATSTPSYPAAYPSCVAVGATDANDRQASFSNHGAGWVDVAAPGVTIHATLPNHKNRIGKTGYGDLSGTSMATPFVAGALALIRAAYPDEDARARLEATCFADPGKGTAWAHGRIDLGAALAPAAPKLPIGP